MTTQRDRSAIAVPVRTLLRQLGFGPETVRWFDLTAHEGAGGGEGGEGGDGGGAGAAGQGAGQGAGGGNDGGQGDSGGDDRTFTQADVDRIVSDRLNRERSKYTDYDDLKDKATKFDELQAEQQTDLERTQSELEQERQRREAAEARAAATATRNKVLELAADKKITDPKLAAKLLDHDKVEFDDDGNPSNVADLLDGLIAEHPLLTATTGDGAGGGEGGGSGDGAGTSGGAGSPDGGAKPEGGGASKNFTTASNADFAKELAKHGLRPRS